MSDLTVKDFKPGDVVRHLFHARHATVTKVGRKLIHVQVHLSDEKVAWLPTSLTKVEQ